MPPEQLGAPQPEVPATPFYKRSIVWISLLFILALASAGVAGAAFYPQWYLGVVRHTAGDSVPSSDGPLQIIKQSQSKFLLPAGWKVDTSHAVALPTGFKDPAIVLTKSDSACVVVQATDVNGGSGKPLSAIKQLSFADRVYSSYAQYDGDWYIASTSATASYSFSNHDRQYLPGEFRVSRGGRNSPFLLFMSNGAAVPDDCDHDLNTLLKTVEPYFDTIRLTASSRGVLKVDKVWDDVAPDKASDKSYEHLVFTPEGSQESFEVMRMPNNTWTEDFFVAGNKLYVASNTYRFDEVKKRPVFSTSISIVDPFAGTLQQIPGTAKEDTYISALYVQGGLAYYLASSSELGSCLDSYHPCAANLYSIPLAGGQPTLIARSSLAGSILGYVASERAFYTRQGWGDAGCIGLHINKIVDSIETRVEKFNGCDGEEGFESASGRVQNVVRAIVAKADGPKATGHSVGVQKGSLVPPTGEIKGPATFHFGN